MKSLKKLKKIMLFIWKTLVSDLFLILTISFGGVCVFQNYLILNKIFGIFIIVSIILTISIGYLIVTMSFNNREVSKNEALKRYLANIQYSTSFVLLFVSIDIFNTLNQKTNLILKIFAYLGLLVVLARTIVLMNILSKNR